jgi:hypothetical protein
MHTLHFLIFINLFFFTTQLFYYLEIILQEIITTQIIFKISESQGVEHLSRAWVCSSALICYLAAFPVSIGLQSIITILI